ncbi:MAG: thiamine pyrophosphate-dependent enzyme, partial [Actinomycetota bacterium]|nr:thiamine pyrophosphate-dependent enzyme [Actinomycetota bacterium]
MDDRVAIVEHNLDRALAEGVPTPARLKRDAPLTPRTGLTAGQAVALFEDQVLSRALDVAARELKRQGIGYYTIASAGHEQNAVVGALLRPTDPCFLHYRSGAFMMARARRAWSASSAAAAAGAGSGPGRGDPVVDTILSLVASADDPIAQGRHKVWGSRPLWVPPQTSTIGSHLPKAVGAAFALERARRLALATDAPQDSVVCCSFGDASVNHATALAAINAARYSQRRGSPVPILLVCEDNRIGISVETPRRWIAETFGGLPHLRYVRAAGEVDEVWEAIAAAVHTCRSSRCPVFVHLEVVRLWGHAGSDVETAYRTPEQIRADEERDPLPRNARRLVAT